MGKLITTVQRMLDRAFPDAWTVTERTCGGTLGLARADAVGMILVDDIVLITKMFPDFIAYVTTQADKDSPDGIVAAVWLTPRAPVAKKPRKVRRTARRK